jgi:hypothetical protein
MLVLVPLWLIAFTTALAIALGLVTGYLLRELGGLGKQECNCCPEHDFETNEETP